MTHPTNTAHDEDEHQPDDIEMLWLDEAPRYWTDSVEKACLTQAEFRTLLEGFRDAVIERLGASDAVPTIWLSERYIGTKVDGEEMYQRPDFTTEQPPSTNRNIRPLYDATALARARQQGYEDARAEFGPDAERYRFVRDHGDRENFGVTGTVWPSSGFVRRITDRMSGPRLDAAIDAARQPTQKET